jgi:hypothetical protein
MRHNDGRGLGDGAVLAFSSRHEQRSAGGTFANTCST